MTLVALDLVESPDVLDPSSSVYDGMEVRGIMQASAGSPLAARPSTWGALKALYR
jgi:hypothetical protein